MTYPPFHPHFAGDLPLVFDAASFSEAFPGEGQHIEFKEGLSADRIGDAVTAFSNAAGGVILVGVADDGSVKGLELNGEREAQIHRVVREVNNAGTYEIHSATVGVKPITVISVAPRRDGFAQTRRGVPLVRRGAMNVPLMGDQLLTFAAQRNVSRYEETVTEIAVQDADGALTEDLAEAMGWRLDQVDDRLEESGLAARTGSGTMLTIAGGLYVLDEPERHFGKCVIEIFRFPVPGGEYDKRLEFGGPVNQQVTEATQAIADELGSDLVVIGLRRHELPRLPYPVIREAIANAVAHRSYEQRGVSTRVDIHPTKVVITSPGPLPEPVTVANIREQSSARNGRVMKVLRLFDLAEEAGRGVDVMQDQMREHLLGEPVFEDTGTSVVVTLPLGGTVSPQERAWVQEVEKRGEIAPQDKVLLVHAARGEILTNTSARQLLDADSVIARQSLQRLRDAGFLVQTGERGGANYSLADDLEAPAGLRLTDTQLADLVLEIAAQGPVTNASVRRRTGLDRTEALRVLRNLVEDGRLVLTGERRGARYVLPKDADRLDL